jgi:hypothetical protein
MGSISLWISFAASIYRKKNIKEKLYTRPVQQFGTKKGEKITANNPIIFKMTYTNCCIYSVVPPDDEQ